MRNNTNSDIAVLNPLKIYETKPNVYLKKAKFKLNPKDSILLNSLHQKYTYAINSPTDMRSDFLIGGNGIELELNGIQFKSIKGYPDTVEQFDLNNFQKKLTRHRKEMNEIIERNKRYSESIDPIQFPEQYRKPLGYGRRIVRGLADLVIPGPSYPQAPSYPQLENGWFRRLHTREFKNLTEEEKKYIDSLSWKKMGDLTEEERAYLRYKGIINPYEYSSNPPPMYVLQNQKRKEEQTNLTERLEREKASSGITGWLKGMIGRAPPTLRPSSRQKQNPKKGGTRRKQKRSNSTRRVKRQSKPAYPSCK